MFISGVTIKDLGLFNGVVGSESTFIGSFGKAGGGTPELKDIMDLIHRGVWMSLAPTTNNPKENDPKQSVHCHGPFNIS